MQKDDQLNFLADKKYNVAQFVSFAPDGSVRYSRVRNTSPNQTWSSVSEAVAAIFSTQKLPSVNIRSFLPEQPDGHPFLYALTDENEVEKKVKELTQKGLFVIVNETIDTEDGGFSGVLFGGVMEVAPFDTPRSVDKAGVMSLPRDVGFKLIKTVYGFQFKELFSNKERVEFSVHPSPVGYLGEQQITWQVDTYDAGVPTEPKIVWPNTYSRAVGDKAFGLLIADLLGFCVPYTEVLGRYIPRFTFGTHTEHADVWLRTCPKEQVSGKFTTFRGWCDPFKLMQQDDPDGKHIASLLVQDSVDSHYSGATITDTNGKSIIEGKKGYGDVFMVGTASQENLPTEVTSSVNDTWDKLKELIGPIRFEWAYDGKSVWVLQLHIGKVESFSDVIFPGEPDEWVDFNVSDGLEKLRELIKELSSTNGINLCGDVGITSHFGDILRKARICSKRTI